MCTDPWPIDPPRFVDPSNLWPMTSWPIVSSGKHRRMCLVLTMHCVLNCIQLSVYGRRQTTFTAGTELLTTWPPWTSVKKPALTTASVSLLTGTRATWHAPAGLSARPEPHLLIVLDLLLIISSIAIYYVRLSSSSAAHTLQSASQACMNEIFIIPTHTVTDLLQ